MINYLISSKKGTSKPMNVMIGLIIIAIAIVIIIAALAPKINEAVENVNANAELKQRELRNNNQVDGYLDVVLSSEDIELFNNFIKTFEKGIKYNELFKDNEFFIKNGCFYISESLNGLAKSIKIEIAQLSEENITVIDEETQKSNLLEKKSYIELSLLKEEFVKKFQRLDYEFRVSGYSSLDLLYIRSVNFGYEDGNINFDHFNGADPMFFSPSGRNLDFDVLDKNYVLMKVKDNVIYFYKDYVTQNTFMGVYGDTIKFCEDIQNNGINEYNRYLSLIPKSDKKCDQIYNPYYCEKSYNKKSGSDRKKCVWDSEYKICYDTENKPQSIIDRELQESMMSGGPDLDSNTWQA
jgi:hypothetical protein